MIDIVTEKVLRFAEAANHIPRRRAGKKTNVSTFYRWAQPGIRGIKLETIYVGATRCTSVEALQRFFDALTARANGQQIEPPKRSRSRKKQIEAAEKRLAKAGV